MKRVVLVALWCLLVFPGLSLAQQGWYRQASSDSGKPLLDVDFVTDQVGTTVGGIGTILRTTNGGTTWVSQVSGVYDWLRGVAFINENRGLAVGESGRILRTTNGGATWLQPSSGTTEVLLDVAFADSNVAVAVGNTIVRSTNGGASWQSITVGGYPQFTSVRFAASGVGAILSSVGSVYWTSDRGATWTPRSSFYYYSTAMALIDSVTAIVATSSGLFFRTTDAGFSWTSVPMGYYDYVNGISFPTPNSGYAVGNNGLILKSIDGGNSWNRQSAGITEPLSSVDFTNGSTGTAVGGNGGIFRTTTGGRQLTLLEPNGGEVWTIGTLHQIRWQSSDVASARIEFSENGGASWQEVSDSVEAQRSAYDWTVPSASSSSCLIRILDASDVRLGDTSDAYFVISERPSITAVPDSFDLTVNEGDSSVVTLTVSNGGPGILGYEVVAGLVTGSPISGTIALPPIPDKPTNVTSPANSNQAWEATRRPLLQAELPRGYNLKGVRILLDAIHGSIDTNSYPWVNFFHDLKTAGVSIGVIWSGSLTDDTLANYDVVLILQPYNIPTIAELFAVQRFVNHGGGLLVCGGYNPTVSSYWTYYAGIQMQWSSWLSLPQYLTDISLHLVAARVDSLTTGYLSSSLLLESPAVSLVRLQDSTVAAASTYGAGSVVGLTSTSFFESYESVDNRLFLLNATSWLAHRAGWVETVPSKGMVAAGSHADIRLTVRSENAVPGTHKVGIRVLSNDPDMPELLVPMVIRIVGRPRIAVAPDTVDFGEVFVSMVQPRKVVVRNEGSDTLHVSAVATSSPLFLLLGSSRFDLLPRRSLEFDVIFSPAAAGIVTGSLTVSSDDPVAPVASVVLRGQGVEMPAVSVTPDSIKFVLPQGGNERKALTVSNNGKGPLTFYLGTEFFQGSTGGSFERPDGGMTEAGHLNASSGGNAGDWSAEYRHAADLFGAPVQASSRVSTGSTASFAERYASSGDTILVVALRGFATSEPGITGTWDFLNQNFLQFGPIPIYIDYSTFSQVDITLDRLRSSGADVLFISDAYRAEHSYGYYSDAEIDAITQYVEEGHGLIFTGGTLNTLRVLRHNRLAGPVGLDPNRIYRWNDGLNFTGTYVDYFSLSNHEIFRQVPTPYWPSFHSSVGVDGGWGNALRGAQLIAFSQPPDSAAITAYRNSLYFSYMPEAYPYYADYQVLYNALVWSGSTVPWLVESALEGTVPPGGSVDVDLAASAEGLRCGREYKAIVHVNSNDPYNPQVNIHVSVEVTGAPNMVTLTDTLTFSETYVGYPDTLSVGVSNTGCDSLRLLSIVTNNPAFVPLMTSGSVATGETFVVPVVFSPSSKGPHDGVLTIAGTAPGNPSSQVRLIGEAFDPPVISVSPDSMLFTVHGLDSAAVPLTVRNTGLGDLRFRIGEELVGIGPDEMVGDTASSFGGGTNRIQGNIYSVTRKSLLRAFSAYVEIQTQAELRFVVYESDVVEGPYARVWESVPIVPPAGRTLLSSGPIDLFLSVQKYYFLGVAHDGSITLFRKVETLPVGTSFGQVRYAAAATQYPPQPSCALARSTGMSIAQLLSTVPSLIMAAAPDSGVVLPNDSAVVQLHMKAPQQSGRHETRVLVLSNDPANPRNPVKIVFNVLTGVAGNGEDIPYQYALHQNYPNPFNPSTVIRFDIPGIRGQGPGVSGVKLVVYDLLGREVAVVVNECKTPGSYTVQFDASGLASGVYLYRLTAGQWSSVKKMVVLK